MSQPIYDFCFFLERHFTNNSFPTDGYAMSQYLPYDNLRFCTEDELTNLRREFHEHKGENLGSTDDTGFALEVTLKFP